MEFSVINVSDCRPFTDNPFQVRDDIDMEMLVESVKDNGIMTPIMVRPRGDNGYEIISGHRRVHACEKAGIEKVPAFILQMSRDEAVICLVDSNLHRDRLLPSEKAFAYKMKAEAISHKGRTCGQSGHKSRNDVSDTESGRTVQRYIRLTNLEKPLLGLVDAGQLGFTSAVELSYLLPEEQQVIAEIYERDEITPSYAQALQLHRLSETGHLTDYRIYDIMSEIKGNQREYVKVSMEKCERFLRRFNTSEEREDYIVKALEFYSRYLERQRSRDAR